MEPLQIEQSYGKFVARETSLLSRVPDMGAEGGSFDRHFADAARQQSPSQANQSSPRRESPADRRDPEEPAATSTAERSTTPSSEPANDGAVARGERMKTTDGAETRPANGEPVSESQADSVEEAVVSAEAVAASPVQPQTTPHEMFAAEANAAEIDNPASRLKSKKERLPEPADPSQSEQETTVTARQASAGKSATEDQAAADTSTAVSPMDKQPKIEAHANNEPIADGELNETRLGTLPEAAVVPSDQLDHDAVVPTIAVEARVVTEHATTESSRVASAKEKRGAGGGRVDAVTPAVGSSGQLAPNLLNSETAVGSTIPTTLAEATADPSANPQPDLEQQATSENRAPREPASTPGAAPTSFKNVVDALTGGPNRTSHATESSEADRSRFVQRVTRAFQSFGEDGGQLRLRLSPAELGSMKLEVTVQNGLLIAHVEAETPEARNLLLENLPVLRERLQDQNIKIERFDVDIMNRQSSDGSSHESARERQQENRARQANQLGRASPSAVQAATSRQPRGGDGNLNVVI